jgi:hypothetical protein
MSVYPRIGEMLVRQGVITQAHLDDALKQQRRKRKRLGEILVQLGFAKESDVADCLAAQFGYQVIDLTDLVPEQDALDLLGADFALSRRVLPIRNRDDSLECVVADPVDVFTTDLIPRPAGKRLVIYVASASELIRAIREAYGLAEAEPDARAVRTKTKRGSRPSGPKPQCDREILLEMITADVARPNRRPVWRAIFRTGSPGS